MLSLLSAPMNVGVLQALEVRAMALSGLREAVGAPPQTTVRSYLKTLTELGVIERSREDSAPVTVEYRLGQAGRDLLPVREALRDWLAQSPHGPLELGSGAAKNATKALVDGWSTTVIRALAARPLSLTELSRLISSINYPSLEGRLREMRLAGLIEARPAEGLRNPYGMTAWLRRAAAPITAAAEWERRFLSGSCSPLTKIDVEAAYLLSVPDLRLEESHSGRCRLAVELPGSGQPAGVMVAVDEGRIVSCVSRLGGHADGWIIGSAPNWTRSVMEGDPGGLEIGGDFDLAMAVLDKLHANLFAKAGAAPGKVAPA